MLLKRILHQPIHSIDLDSGRTLNKHLNTEPFGSDNLHLNRKGYEKLSKFFIGKIESPQIILRRQNLKAPRNYTKAVSFSIVDDKFSPLLSLYALLMFVNFCPLLILVNIYVLLTLVNLNVLKPVRPVDFNNSMCTVDGLGLVSSVNFSQSVHPIDVLNFVLSVNLSKIICPVNSDKLERPVNSSTLARPVNSSNFVLSVDIRTVDSNKPLRPVNSSKSLRPVDVTTCME